MKTTFYIKNMVCDRCIKVLKNELDDQGIKVIDVKLGELTVNLEKPSEHVVIRKVVESNGFNIIDDDNFKLVEQIKLVMIKLLDQLPLKASEKLSETIAKELPYEYSRISKIFSYSEKTTIEKYFIKLKIEKAKELIQNKELNFTQISDLLNYSNLTHLSKQFKMETGMNLTEYKSMNIKVRNSLDQII